MTAPEPSTFVQAIAPIEGRARRVARRLCASSADGDDLFQDAVLRAFEHFTDLRDPERFSSWFFAILFQAHRARGRRAAIMRFLSLDGIFGGDEPPAPPSASTDETLGNAQRFQAALASLSPKAREAVVAFELEGMTLDEMAAITGDQVGALKTRLSRAREQLRAYYTQCASTGDADVRYLSAGRVR
jgi:RNA polymerase sigma-70 factor (ECF subfamily)